MQSEHPVKTWAVADGPAWRKGVAGLLALVVLAYVGLALLGLRIIVYDTDHFGDTMLLLGGAWRVLNGLEPAVDFGHFYGGFIASWVAGAMQMFDPGVHAYQQATLMMFAAAALATAAISWGRLSAVEFLLALLVIATLLFTQHPLESSGSVTRVMSTHSFLYNRVGLVLLLLCCLYMVAPSGWRVTEIGVGVLVGAAALSAAYTKPTFIILPVFLLLGLTVQARWAALAAVAATMALLVVVLDPWAARFLGSLAYTQAQVGDRSDASVLFLLVKSIQLVLAQPITLTLVLGATCLTLFHDRGALRGVLGIMAIAVAGVGMGSTMGAGGALGQQMLPVACALLIALAALTRLRQAKPAALVGLAALVVSVGFSLPHLANLAAAHFEAHQKRTHVRIESGPLAGYLSVTEHTQPDGFSQYRLLAEGLATLDSLGIGPDYGIIADRGVSFEFARLAKPVPGYPLWTRLSAPEFAPGVPIPPEADVVMLHRTAEAGVGAEPTLRAILTEKMEEDFVLCTRTAFWDVFVRRTQILPTCELP